MGSRPRACNSRPPKNRQIAQTLDALGIDYIEGGWPGANPTDSAFFDAAPATRATMTAFGMTKRAGRSAENDDVLAAVMNAGTRAVCLVGKTHDFHVETALGISLDENISNIRQSMEHHCGSNRAAKRCLMPSISLTATHPTPPMRWTCLKAAHDAGARWIVLCDTNGGTLPS